jgi:hypothetical protein
MQFEGQDLTTYAEPVSASSLREGSTYFFVFYIDQDLCIPLMETVVFVGRYLSSEGTELLRFQDVRSYNNGIRFGSPDSNQAQFQSCTENSMNHLFEYEKALDELMRCALRRKKRSQ